MDLQLKQSIKIIGKYKGRTKYPFWTDIEDGDILTLSLPINGITTHGYVPRLKIKNDNKDKWSPAFSMTETFKYLKNLDYEIVKDKLYEVY